MISQVEVLVVMQVEQDSQLCEAMVEGGFHLSFLKASSFLVMERVKVLVEMELVVGEVHLV